jgi:hypothetical protein
VTVDRTAYATPADFDARRQKALFAGFGGLAICLLGFFLDPGHLFRAWLTAYLLFLGISLGSMAMVMIQHLSGGQWGVFRRIFEAAARTLPLLALLFLPVVLGMGSLYVWTHADHVQADEILRHKAPYLNTPFFLVRALIYFVCWIAMSWTLTRLSARQDEGDMTVNMRLQRLSGAGLVIYALTVTAAGIDWIMSINPHWYSTLFGFLMMGGQGLAALAFAIIVATFLVKDGALGDLLKPSHFHDLGKLMFAFVMLWAYFNFSQFLLTYAANLIEEIPYFVTRMSNGWEYVALFLVVFHFAVPWLLLLSRDRKRNPYRLVWVAAWILFVRYVDIYMLIAPEFASTGENLHMATGEGEHVSHFFVHWLDLAAPLAIGGLWLWMFMTQLAQRPLFALRDPYLRASLESGGGH